MKKTHHYENKTVWTGNTGSSTKNYRSYERAYTISVEGKADLNGSSDPAFLRNPELHKIRVAQQDMVEKAMELHHTAGEYCFIANSLNFKVRHEPEITFGTASDF